MPAERTVGGGAKVAFTVSKVRVLGIDRSIDHHSPSTRQGGSGTAGIGVRSDAQGQFFRFPIQWYDSDPFSPIFSSNKPPVPGQQQRIFFFFFFEFAFFPSRSGSNIPGTFFFLFFARVIPARRPWCRFPILSCVQVFII